jgi:hypothetical protein
MRKLLLVLAIIASPAFAHDLPYSDPKFLKVSGGDPVKAQELDFFCSTSGLNAGKCANSLSGSGNLMAEAARKCAQQSIGFQSPMITGGKIDPRLAHKIDGRVDHFDYRSGGETGRLHRSYYTKTDEQLAYESRKRQLYEDYERAVKIIRDQVTNTNEGGISGKGTVGVPGVGSAEVGGSGSKKTTTELAILTEKDRRTIEAEADKARHNPKLGGIEPSGLCFAGETMCEDGDGHFTPNSSYDPKVEAKEKENEKKTGKKTSSNDDRTPHEHEHEDSNVIPEIISTSGRDSWVGNDVGGEPKTAWATPVMDETNLPATWMEKCLEFETRKLEKEIGSSTKLEGEEHADVNMKAAELLSNGYCTESVYGREYCTAFKLKHESVVAVDIRADRQGNYNSAISTYKQTGRCDPNALGEDFCKGVKDRWKVNPLLNDEGLDTGFPSLILKKKPIKSGTLPKVMERN